MSPEDFLEFFYHKEIAYRLVFANYLRFGLSEFKHTPGFLIGTMQSSQDVYEAWIKYFNEELYEGLKME